MPMILTFDLDSTMELIAHTVTSSMHERHGFETYLEGDAEPALWLLIGEDDIILQSNGIPNDIDPIEPQKVKITEGSNSEIFYGLEVIDISNMINTDVDFKDFNKFIIFLDDKTITVLLADGLKEI